MKIDIDNVTPMRNDDQTWEPLTVTIEGTDENHRLVGKQMEKQIESYKIDPLADGYKFEIDSEKWLFEGCWLQGVNYSSMDMTGTENDTIEITLRFDNATEKSLGFNNIIETSTSW